MRDIEFRGQKIDTKEWVYGGYSKHIKDENRVFITVMSKDHISDIGWHQEVIPKTIGQFTGWHDKNGKKIYEGDIVNCREHECFGKIEWNEDNVSFYFCVLIDTNCFDEDCLYDFVDELEVIGNIHDNAELLTVQS